MLTPLENKVKTVSFDNLKNISSYAFPIFFYKKNILNKFKKLLEINKIEYRPIISGNILKQPFLKMNKKMINSDFVHNNGIYIGNNQFVTPKMIKNLITLIKKV